MKNLATCTPSEFISQTAKIREAVANWLELIDLQKIRGRKPEYEVVNSKATAEQRAEVIQRNAELLRKQTMQNINDILDNMLSKHPQETLEVLALCCFVDPAEVDSHPMSEYLGCIMDIMENKDVLRFFSLLVRLDTKSTLTA